MSILALLALLVLLLLGTAGPGATVGYESTSVPASIGTLEAEQGWAHPEWFADPAWLEQHLADPTVTVVALTPEEEFLAGHIPGAVQIDWPALEIVETSGGSLAAWRSEVEGILTRLGITPADTVVIYDGGSFYAARLWWVLDQLGHADKRILDGGLPAWQSAGMPLEAAGTWVGHSPADPYVGTPNEEAIATIEEVEAAVSDPGVALVDARSPEEYAEGHIPGAVNIPFTENAVADSGGRWKRPEELRAMYMEAGVTPDRLVIPYCLTGVRSAVTYFTLRALGYERVTLFTGSWAEWSADPARPVER